MLLYKRLVLRDDKIIIFVCCQETWEPEAPRILGAVHGCSGFALLIMYLIHAFQLESCQWVKLRTDIISTECYVGNCMK